MTWGQGQMGIKIFFLDMIRMVWVIAVMFIKIARDKIEKI